MKTLKLLTVLNIAFLFFHLYAIINSPTNFNHVAFVIHFLTIAFSCFVFITESCHTEDDKDYKDYIFNLMCIYIKLNNLKHTYVKPDYMNSGKSACVSDDFLSDFISERKRINPEAFENNDHSFNNFLNDSDYEKIHSTMQNTLIKTKINNYDKLY